MAILNYNLSSNLQSLLQEISVLRQNILLAQIPPAIEVRLRWEALLSKVYWGLTISNSPVSKAEIGTLLAYQTKKRLNQFQKEVVAYKNTLTYIKQDWLLSGKKVT